MDWHGWAMGNLKMYGWVWEGGGCSYESLRRSGRQWISGGAVGKDVHDEGGAPYPHTINRLDHARGARANEYH